MKGDRKKIYQYACNTEGPVNSVLIGMLLDIDDALASRHLSDMTDAGCFTREWRVEARTRWYDYHVVRTCPPPGTGNYDHKKKPATPRIPSGSFGGFRYAPYERLPVVRL